VVCPSRGLTLKTFRSAHKVLFCILLGYQEKNGNYFPSTGLAYRFLRLKKMFTARYELNLYYCFLSVHLQALSQNFEKRLASSRLSLRPFVRPSFRTEQLGSQRTDFHEI